MIRLSAKALASKALASKALASKALASKALASKALASLLLLSPVVTAAQEWPTRQPIKIVVPFTAGSATDITARTVFDQVGKQIGQNFVVENRGGAGTTLGSAMVAKADPDGYTLLANSTSQVVVASTYFKLSFNVAEDSCRHQRACRHAVRGFDDHQIQIDERRDRRRQESRAPSSSTAPTAPAVPVTFSWSGCACRPDIR